MPGEEEAQKLFSIFEDKLMSILHLYADPKPGVTEAVELLREKGIKRRTMPQNGRKIPGCGSGPGIPYAERAGGIFIAPAAVRL